MNFLLRYLELIFTAAGLLVIFGVTLLVQPAGYSYRSIAAITATAVGVIHGALFWVIRYRQRLARREALQEAQRMLRDVVLNQLAIVRLNAELQNHPAKSTAAAFTRLESAIGIIDQTLSDLSEESLARWRSHYNTTLPLFSD